jgi:hypothetical protein
LIREKRLQKILFINYLILNEMKNLDVNAYGVCEMDVAEMKATDGGCWFFVLGCVLVAAFLADWLSDGKINGEAAF